MLVPDAYVKIEDVGDEIDQNRHQHLKFVTTIFRLQHPSQTSMKFRREILFKTGGYGRTGNQTEEPEIKRNANF